MLIQDMAPERCIDLFETTHIGRIACARNNQPYVTPFSFVYHDRFIYSFATVGKKLDWMRANPLVCVEIEKIVSRQEWQTVVAFGRYEELPATAELYEMRTIAHDLLAEVPDWWEPGYARTTHLGADRRLEPIYFRVSIDEINGHQGVAQS